MGNSCRRAGGMRQARVLQCVRCPLRSVARSPRAAMVSGFRRSLQLLSYISFELYTLAVWEVDVTLVRDWLLSLGQDDYDLVIAALELLQDDGPMLGRPLVDTLVGSRHKNMKELRPGSRGRSEVRILFAFDPRRRAILLVAGDKAGNWRRWYVKNIPVADALFDAHLDELRQRRKP